MPSRALHLLAVLCACAGLSLGLAACGSDEESSTETVSLTELPGNPEAGDLGSGGASSGSGGSSADADAGGGSSGGANAGDDASAGDGSAGDGGEEASAGGAADGGEGKAIFTQSCAGCHTLADAGASGSVGPNLDEVRPDEATVAAMVRSGGGGMPSFDGTLSPEQIEAVAAYVSSSAGS